MGGVESLRGAADRFVRVAASHCRHHQCRAARFHPDRAHGSGQRGRTDLHTGHQATLNISDSPFDPPYTNDGGFYVSGSITDPTGIEGPSGGQAFLQVLTASNPVWTTIAVDDSPSYLFFDADFTFTENAQYKVVFTGSTALGTWDDSYVAGESVPTTRSSSATPRAP